LKLLQRTRANLLRNYSQETGSLPRSQAWWLKVIASITLRNERSAKPHGYLPSKRHHVRSILVAIFQPIEDTRVITFLRSQEEHGKQAFFGSSTLSAKRCPISGPCTKCIITHTTFLLKLLFLSNFSLQQLCPSGFFTSEQSSSTSGSRTPHREPSTHKPYQHIMLFVNSKAIPSRLSSFITFHSQRRARELPISSLKRPIMFCSLSVLACQMCCVQSGHHFLLVLPERRL
jgi:hypothetical protein